MSRMAHKRPPTNETEFDVFRFTSTVGCYIRQAVSGFYKVISVSLFRCFTSETFYNLIRTTTHRSAGKDAMLIVTPEHKQPPPQHHPFRFKPEKALEALLYLVNRMEPKKRSRYFLNKLFFFSDLHHLDQYSRYIAGDFYVAMEEGPVPSNAYNMMKEMAGIVEKEFGLPYEESFSVKKRTYLEFYDPRRDANLDVLSPSDIECLDYALERYGRVC
jgi:hypothetical protein